MFTYQVKNYVNEFSVVLTEEWLNNDIAQPHAKSFKGSKWFTDVQNAIYLIEPVTALTICKTRLY